MGVNATIVAVTHGFPDDARQIERLVRSQSVLARQLVIVGEPDASVRAEYVSARRLVQGLQRALLAENAPVVVFVDSAHDLLPDHLETMLQHVAAGVTPVPTVHGAKTNGAGFPGAHLLAARLSEILGVGGIWGLWEGAEGPPGLWAADLIRRLAIKYARRPEEVPVYCRLLPERAIAAVRGDHCGLQLYAMTRDDPVTANRRCQEGLLAQLRAPCAFYEKQIDGSECAVSGNNCLAPWAAFGVPKAVVRQAARLPAGRIRRAYYARRRRV